MRTHPHPSRFGRQRQSLITHPRRSRSQISKCAWQNWSGQRKRRSQRPPDRIGERMKAALRSRLERLEVRLEPKKPQLIRSGYLKTLPTDYVGERHVVIVNRKLSGKGEWCEFEERPGPAPVDAREDDG